MITETLVCSSELTPIDLLLWRHFRGEDQNRVETILNDNRGAGDHLFLLIGQSLTFHRPEPNSRPPKARPVVSLYD